MSDNVDETTLSAIIILSPTPDSIYYCGSHDESLPLESTKNFVSYPLKEEEWIANGNAILRYSSSSNPDSRAKVSVMNLALVAMGYSILIGPE